jgi:hypothetical protein
MPTFVRAFVLLLVVTLTACETTPPRPPEKPAPVEPKPVPKPVPPAAKPVPPSPAPPRDAEPATQPVPKAADELRRGLQRYDDGEYKEAARLLQRALELGLASPAEQASARKHLAFMACVAKRTSVCRAEFRKAFEADPAFTLAPAEAGHPMWGPVFKSVQAEVAKKRKPVPAEPRR